MNTVQLYSLLEEKHNLYNRPGFIEGDPISVPHLFSSKEDIEIAGFLTATISWGNRKSIVASARRLMKLMDNSPHDFLVHAAPREFRPFLGFVHRTFSGDDCLFFLTALKRIYKVHGGPETLFSEMDRLGAAEAICRFRNEFLSEEHLSRTEKHLANPLAGSAAKRINMFLRWMVRRDSRGVDFGLWSTIDPASLVCPLDVHSGNIARRLGLITRRQNDWKAAMELTAALRSIDPADPVKYDFALFGMGVFEKA